MPSEKEFKINEYITLKLEDERTVLYIKEKPFIICKRLLLHIPENLITKFDEVDSIDAATDLYEKTLLDGKMYEGFHEPKLIDTKVDISYEEEFWGHCSNLQVWYENNYDTRLIYYNLAFPLLKKLTQVGDPLAKKVFKEEIVLRIMTKYPPVLTYLFETDYLNYLNSEEKEILLTDLIINGLDWIENESLSVSLGSQLYDIGMPEKAIDCYQKALEINSECVDAWNSMGNIYGEMNLIDRAIEYYRKAINIDPKSFTAWFKLSVIYHQLGLTNETLQCYGKLLEIDPRNTRVWHNLGVLYKTFKLYDKAIECYNRALSTNPEFVHTIYQKACLESLLNNRKNAIELLKKVINLNKKFKTRAKTDKELDNIRQLKEFKDLMKE